MVDGLTLERLAAAAGLSRERAQDLCQRFAVYLPASGSRAARRWLPNQVATLRSLHSLDSAGYSVEQIRDQLAPSDLVSLRAPVVARPATDPLSLTPPEPAPPLALEEALRTIGLGLDRHGVVRVAQFTIDSRGILVDAASPPIHALHTWATLGVESESQRQARRSSPQPAPDADLLALTRWGVLLRLIGVLLDADRIWQCMLEVQIARVQTPTVYEVQVHTEGRTRLWNEDVQQLLLRRRAQHAHRSGGTEPLKPASDPPHRRWWPRA